MPKDVVKVQWLSSLERAAGEPLPCKGRRSCRALLALTQTATTGTSGVWSIAPSLPAELKLWTKVLA